MKQLSLLAVLLCLTLSVTAAKLPLEGTIIANHGITYDENVELTGDLTISLLNQHIKVVVTGNISGDYNLTIRGSGSGGTVILEGQQNYTGKTIVENGATLIREVNLPTNPLINIHFNSSEIELTEDNSELIFDIRSNGNNKQYIFDKPISGDGKLTKKGDAKLNLSVNKTYAGKTTVEEGILEILTSPSSGFIPGITFQSEEVEIQKDTELIVQSNVNGRANSYNYNGKINGSGKFTKKGNGVFNIVEGLSLGLVGNAVVETGGLKIQKYMNTNIELAENTNLEFVAHNDFEYGYIISGDGDFILSSKAGENHKFTFVKEQTYTGKTTLASNHTLALKGEGRVEQSSQVILHDNATIDCTELDGLVVKINNLSSEYEDATILLDGGLYIELNNDMYDVEYKGRVEGSGNLNFRGEEDAKWTFSGVNEGNVSLRVYSGNLYLASDWPSDLGVSTDQTTLEIVGNRSVAGNFIILDSKPTINFDLTASEPSKLTFEGGIIVQTHKLVTLNVKADDAGVYDLIEVKNIKLNNYELNLTGAWKEGVLEVKDNKLRLTVPDTEEPTVSNNSIGIEHLTDSTILISWESANDNLTERKDLEYYVCVAENKTDLQAVLEHIGPSTADPILGSEGTLSKGKLIFNYEIEEYYKVTNNRGEIVLNKLALASDKTYSISVVVKDKAGNTNLYKPVDAKTLPKTGLAEIQAEGIDLFSRDGVLHINLSKQDDISIYDVSGAVVHAVIQAFGDISIPLAQGLYIVKIATNTVKIMVQ